MIPIYEAIINDESEGILKISLVDLPAVESDFLAFKQDNTQPQKYSIQDPDQRIVYGVLMRADFNIYRYCDSLGEYYIRYSKDTIKKMAEKLMLDGYHNNINLMHSLDTDGVNLLQLFIKDTEKGIDPKGFDDIEEGSLFAVYKVNNDEVWRSIKDGVFKGYSLEGFFEIKPIKENNLMSKFEKMKKQILSILMEFGEMNTDKGKIYWSGEEDLKVGDEALAEVDGKPLEDGEYTADDGKVITVADGKVASIEEPKPSADETVEMEVEEVSEEPSTEEPNEIETLKQEVEDLKKSLASLKETVDELLAVPNVEPVAEEFTKAALPEDSKMSKAVAVASALRK